MSNFFKKISSSAGGGSIHSFLPSGLSLGDEDLSLHREYTRLKKRQKKINKKMKEFESYTQSRINTLEEQNSSLEDEIKQLKDEKLCGICYNNPKQVTLSCGHLVCEACSEELENRNINCPYCKQIIFDKIKVFNL